MQQMVQQAMQPKPVGIEGVQSNIGQYKEGGIIGYAGPTGSFVTDSGNMVGNLSAEEINRMSPETRKAYFKKLLEQRNASIPVPPTPSSPAMSAKPAIGIAGAIAKKLGPLALLAELFGTSDADIATLEKAEQERRAMPVEVDSRPRGQENYEPIIPPDVAEAQRNAYAQYAGSDRRAPTGVAVPPTRPPAPAPSPSAQPEAPSAPQAGIAQLVAPTPESAMASARSTLGLGDTTALRAKEEAYQAALKAQPAAGQQGLAALQAQQSDLQRGYDKAEKESNINSAIQWLLGGREGSGGSARASIAFSEKEDARRKTYGELQVANATKRDAIIDLENARNAGNAKEARDAEIRIRAADMEIAKAEGNLAANFASSQANVYGTQVRSQDEAANREANRKLEEYRRQTQLMKPKEQDNVVRLESMKLAELTGGKPESATPSQKLEALDFAIKTARGTGVEEKAGLANARQRATMIQNELKERLGMDPQGKSPRVQQLQRELDSIYRELGGGAPAPAGGGTVDKNNPLLK